MEQKREIKDIWFRTALSLEELADSMEWMGAISDRHNSWEWVQGHWKNMELCITRFAEKPPEETDTLMCKLDRDDNISFEEFHELKEILMELGISTLQKGERIARKGDHFEFRLL